MTRTKKPQVKLELYKYADVSTGHISEEDSMALAQDASACDERWQAAGSTRHIYDTTPRLIVHSYDSGHWVHTHVAEDKEEMKALESRYSKECLAVTALAFRAGAIFVRFDRDAAIYDSLPQFNW